MLDLDLYQAKKLYPFQEKTVNAVLDELRKNGSNFNLLYQLPTGGGKTVIFSEIAKRYVEESGKKSWSSPTALSFLSKLQSNFRLSRCQTKSSILRSKL